MCGSSSATSSSAESKRTGRRASSAVGPCRLASAGSPSSGSSEARYDATAKLADPSLTPSARVLQTMRDKQQSFLEFGLEQSEAHAAYFRAHPLDAGTAKAFADLAAQSLEEQAKLEREEIGSFDAFVAAYRAYTLNRFSV